MDNNNNRNKVHHIPQIAVSQFKMYFPLSVKNPIKQHFTYLRGVKIRHLSICLDKAPLIIVMSFIEWGVFFLLGKYQGTTRKTKRSALNCQIPQFRMAEYHSSVLTFPNCKWLDRWPLLVWSIGTLTCHIDDNNPGMSAKSGTLQIFQEQYYQMLSFRRQYYSGDSAVHNNPLKHYSWSNYALWMSS